MNMQLRPGSELKAAAAVKPAIADCDIHPTRKNPRDIYPYLEKRWQDHLDAYGSHFYQGMLTGPAYPKGQPNASRRDAVPPEGGPQGSSLKFMQQQHLDPNNVALGMLCPLSVQGLRNHDLGAALASRVVGDRRSPLATRPVALPEGLQSRDDQVRQQRNCYQRGRDKRQQHQDRRPIYRPPRAGRRSRARRPEGCRRMSAP